MIYWISAMIACGHIFDFHRYPNEYGRCVNHYNSCVEAGVAPVECAERLHRDLINRCADLFN